MSRFGYGMTVNFPRNTLVPGGFVYEMNKARGHIIELPDTTAYVTSQAGKWTHHTWDEFMAERRKRQAERLERIRFTRVDRDGPLPCYVWTFFNKQDIPYHGWYCYVRTRHFDVAVNFRGFRQQLALSIMSEVPCGLLPIPENFEAWMEAFTKSHPRRPQKIDKRKAGSICGWLTNESTFTLKRP